MKYLIMAKPGDTAMPREQAAELLAAGLEFMKAKLASGSLDVAYNVIGGGGMGIGNAESHEELLGNLLDYPLYPFFNWEITPLLDLDESIAQYISFYNRISSA